MPQNWCSYHNDTIAVVEDVYVKKDDKLGGPVGGHQSEIRHRKPVWRTMPFKDARFSSTPTLPNIFCVFS